MVQRTELAWACRILYHTGMNDVTLGHISVLDRASGQVYMKPRGLGFDEVCPDDLVAINLEGQKTGGAAHGVHGEWPIHTEIFKARPDVNCVVHVHPMHATALACVDNPLELLAHDAILFHDGVGIYDGPPDLVVRPDEGVLVARALGSHRAVLMRNHGVTATGHTIAAAVCTAMMLERAAQFQVICRSLGTTRPVTPGIAAHAALAARGSDRQFNEFFGYLIRQCRRAGLGDGMPAA